MYWSLCTVLDQNYIAGSSCNLVNKEVSQGALGHLLPLSMMEEEYLG